jgi:hypothetical protein
MVVPADAHPAAAQRLCRPSPLLLLRLSVCARGRSRCRGAVSLAPGPGAVHCSAWATRRRGRSSGSPNRTCSVRRRGSSQRRSSLPSAPMTHLWDHIRAVPTALPEPRTRTMRGLGGSVGLRRVWQQHMHGEPWGCGKRTKVVDCGRCRRCRRCRRCLGDPRGLPPRRLLEPLCQYPHRLIRTRHGQHVQGQCSCAPRRRCARHALSVVTEGTLL